MAAKPEVQQEGAEWVSGDRQFFCLAGLLWGALIVTVLAMIFIPDVLPDLLLWAWGN